MTDQVIKQLQKRRRKFQLYTWFSDQPGIYAFFFHGSHFPLPDYRPNEDEILYIGKTLTSEESRSLKTHFTAGRTGSSTVRRTFGALLRNELDLKPVPRNLDGTPSSHYKFDELSEEKLSKWMRENLGLAFYPYPKSPTEIGLLEKSLIVNLAPVLNLKDNPQNPYLNMIKSERRTTLELAGSKRSGRDAAKLLAGSTRKESLSKAARPQGLYTQIWRNYYPGILECLEKGTVTFLQLEECRFTSAGNRKSFSFRLEIKNGRINNNIGGSAVARDLAAVIFEMTSSVLNVRMNLSISMDKNFKLKIGSGTTI